LKNQWGSKAGSFLGNLRLSLHGQLVSLMRKSDAVFLAVVAVVVLIVVYLYFAYVAPTSRRYCIPSTGNAALGVKTLECKDNRITFLVLNTAKEPVRAVTPNISVCVETTAGRISCVVKKYHLTRDNISNAILLKPGEGVKISITYRLNENGVIADVNVPWMNDVIHLARGVKEPAYWVSIYWYWYGEDGKPIPKYLSIVCKNWVGAGHPNIGGSGPGT